MKNKSIVALAVATLVASTLYASPSQHEGSKQNRMMKHGKHQMKGGHMMVGMFMKLDLSDTQRAEIKQVLQDSRKKMSSPSDAFTSTSFDKEKFIKLVKQRKEGKIERKAEVIEKMYNVLNDSQKKDLKTMIDMKKLKRKNHMSKALKNGGKCAAHCNDRG
jgi:Spy/CpxP family protein refolding chaperone